MELTDLKANKIVKQEMLIENARLRVNTDAGNSVLFLTDAGRNRIVMLDKTKNEYTEIDQQSMNQLGAQMQGAMAQMEAAMKNMPPEQRAMMEKMMKGKMPVPQAAPATTTYSAKGSATVNGFACTRYDGERAGSKVAEVCAAPLAAVRVSASDFQLFDKMREFMSGLQSALKSSPFASSTPGFTERGFEGFPVQRIEFDNGQAVQRVDLKSADQTTFGDSDFSLGNAKKVNLPAAPR